jgi:hypothetical protein
MICPSANLTKCHHATLALQKGSGAGVHVGVSDSIAHEWDRLLALQVF